MLCWVDHEKKFYNLGAWLFSLNKYALFVYSGADTDRHKQTV